MFNEAWGEMVEVSSPQTLPELLNVVELLQSDLALLVAKPSSPEDHFWACFGTVLAALRAE